MRGLLSSSADVQHVHVVAAVARRPGDSETSRVGESDCARKQNAVDLFPSSRGKVGRRSTDPPVEKPSTPSVLLLLRSNNEILLFP